MKSSELHKLIRTCGWQHIRTNGSHYIYEKNGKRYPVPYHGAKEVGKGMEIRLEKKWT